VLCDSRHSIGIWAWVETQLAKRNPKNRLAGTPLTVPVSFDRRDARWRAAVFRGHDGTPDLRRLLDRR